MNKMLHQVKLHSSKLGTAHLCR